MWRRTLLVAAKTAKIFLLSWLIPCSLMAQSSEPNETKYDRSHISVTGRPSDSTVTIHYSIEDSSHVELRVTHRTGEIFAALVNENKPPGRDSVRLDTRTLPEGTYTVELILDHIRSEGIHRGWFSHTHGERQFTNSRIEIDLLNEAIQMVRSNPSVSKRLFDSLLIGYPAFLNRSAAFSYSVFSFCQTADSASLHSIIDSLLARLPISYSYRTIAMALTQSNRELEFAERCARKAIEMADSIPEPYRDSYRLHYFLVLADAQIARGNDKLAEETLHRALAIHENLPLWDRFVFYNVDIFALKKLIGIKLRQRQYFTSSNLCREALMKESGDSELWAMLQYSYVMSRGSAERYEAYRRQVELSLGLNLNKPNRPDSLVGTRSPSFDLRSLDTISVKSIRFKGKVLLMLFWSFWNGDLPERPAIDSLYRHFAGDGLAALAIHSPIGLYGFRQIDSAGVVSAMKAYPVSFSDVLESENSQLSSNLGVRTYPTFVVVDKQGIIRYRELGFDRGATLERLSQVLKKLTSPK